MMDDIELLGRFATDCSEKAFAELVGRHLNLVYATALRRLDGRADLAEDVTQSVFIDLARKASLLSKRTGLVGWLFSSTHYAAAKVIRAERRRRAREQQSVVMNENHSPAGTEVDWNSLRPMIDPLILRLNHRDREAILLRFFEGRDYSNLGKELRLSEDGARSRAERALKKLHAMLVRRGVTSTTAALAFALSSQVSVAAPAGLATAINGAVLAGGVLGGAGSSAAFGFLKLMSTTKLNLGIVSAVCILTTAAAIDEAHQAHRIGRDLASAHNVEAERIENIRILQAKLATLEKARAADERAMREQARSFRRSKAPGTDPNGTVTDSPIYQKLQAIQAKGQLDSRYGALFKSLALTPEQLNQFKNLLIEKQQEARDALMAATRDGIFGLTAKGNVTMQGIQGSNGSSLIGQAVGNAVGPIDQQIHTLLGDSGYNQLQQYEQTLPERASIAQLRQSLSYTSSPLGDDQANELIQLLAQNAPQGIRFSVSDGGPLVSSQTAQITDEEIAQAPTVLSAQQVQALKQLQQQQQAQRQMQQLLHPRTNESPSAGGG